MIAFLKKLFKIRKPIAVIVFPDRLWNNMDEELKQQWKTKLEEDYHVFMYAHDRCSEVDIKIYSIQNETN